MSLDSSPGRREGIHLQRKETVDGQIVKVCLDQLHGTLNLLGGHSQRVPK